MTSPGSPSTHPFVVSQMAQFCNLHTEISNGIIDSPDWIIFNFSMMSHPTPHSFSLKSDEFEIFDDVAATPSPHLTDKVRLEFMLCTCACVHVACGCLCSCVRVLVFMLYACATPCHFRSFCHVYQMCSQHHYHYRYLIRRLSVFEISLKSERGRLYLGLRTHQG